MARKAPGRHERKGLSLVDITRIFPDDATAEEWFVQNRWPAGACCPECGSLHVQERPTRKPQPYRCRVLALGLFRPDTPVFSRIALTPGMIGNQDNSRTVLARRCA